MSKFACLSFLAPIGDHAVQARDVRKTSRRRITSPLRLYVATLCAVIVAFPVRAENIRQTVEWQLFDDKDALTDKVTRRVAGQVTFPDGNKVQVLAKCAEAATGGRYPGLTIVVGAFDAGNSAPKPYAWQNGAVQLPILVNDQKRPAVHAHTENPRANLISVGFYDPTAARRLTHVEVPPFLRQIDAYRPVAELKQQVAWDNFVAGAGGTLPELLQASSIRVQLPLVDGSADVVELSPQDATLKVYAQQCNAQFQARAH